MQSPNTTDGLFRYAETWNPGSLREFVDLGRMTLFGMPIRRNSWFMRPTPGCLRVKLYFPLQDYRESRPCLEQADFPLEADGSFDMRQVKAWWGIGRCWVIDPCRWNTFKAGNPNRLSPIAVETMTDGKNTLNVLWEPQVTDEYEHYQSLLKHEISLTRRFFLNDPQWYFARLFAVCAALWIASLLPMIWEIALMVHSVVQDVYETCLLTVLVLYADDFYQVVGEVASLAASRAASACGISTWYNE